MSDCILDQVALGVGRLPIGKRDVRVAPPLSLFGVDIDRRGAELLSHPDAIIVIHAIQLRYQPRRFDMQIALKCRWFRSPSHTRGTGAHQSPFDRVLPRGLLAGNRLRDRLQRGSRPLAR